VLIVEDSEDDAILIAHSLRRGGYDLTFERVDTPQAFRDALAQQVWDAVIADYSMPHFDGLSALKLLHESGLDLPFVVVSGTIGEETAVAAMKAGAHDYVMKDNLARLVPAVRRELHEAEGRRARMRAEAALHESEARNRALLSAIPDLIFQISKDGIYLDVILAKNLEPLIPADELIGNDVYHVLPPKVAQRRMRCIERVLKTGEAQVHEYRLVRNGKQVDYEARIVASGADQVLAIVRDISVRVRAEDEKNRLLERMQRQQTALVHLATYPPLAEGRLDETFQATAESAAETLGVEQVNIWRLSADGRGIYCLETFELSTREHNAGRVLSTKQYPQYFAALKAGRVVDASDVKSDPRTVELTADCWEPQGIGASLSAPIRVHGQVTGLVCCDHRGPPRTWTPDEVAFVVQVADLLAQAFLNADLRRRAEELAAITRVGREITSVPDLVYTFDSIARHAAELSHSDASGVFVSRSDGRMYIEAGHGVAEVFIAAINAQGVSLRRGAIGQAAAARGPIQIPDVLIEPGYSYTQLAKMEHIRGVLAVPMLKGEDVTGGIVLWHRQPRHFAPEEVAFIQALAQQCVSAIENARLFEAEARRRREAETLRAATQALSATLDRQRLFELILSELQQVVPYDSASVQQLQGDQLEIIGGHGFPNLDELLGESFDLMANDNPNREVVRSRTPLILDDASAAYEAFCRKPHAQANIRSWLGVPLLFGDRLIGMIALDKREPGFYSEEHARLAMAFATQAAIAMENARIFAAEEQRAVALAHALEKQRELDLLKNVFIQNVSHELRTPLGLIQGYAELLDSGELGELQTDQREPVAVIARRARMLGKLVEDLTAILETETQKAKREPLNLGNLVRQTLADFEVTMEQASLTLTSQIAPDLPPVCGDPTHLRRVLDNLLGNALKFTPAGGRISVRLEQVGENIVLHVTDTGVGIPANQLKRIFERFYQVDGSMSRRYGGAGLGLALVKEIVEAHEGSVSVESQPGQGSTFRIRLPASVD
jgi:signal transduction histidine kinase/CheY-like chemotaxis protein